MMLTKEQQQDYFTRAVEGLASQNFRQSMNGAACAYRGADGCRCAVGWLIPDEKYDERTMEGGCSFDVVLPAIGVTPAGESYLYMETPEGVWFRGLQHAHDRADVNEDGTRVSDLSRVAENMKAGLKKFAKTWRLDVPAVLR